MTVLQESFFSLFDKEISTCSSLWESTFSFPYKDFLDNLVT